MNARLPLPTVDGPGRVIADPAELTPEWITGVLRDAGLDVRVARTGCRQIGTGQVGATYQVTLEYAGARPDRAPDSVVAKIAVGDHDQRSRISPAFVSEVGFYLHLADRTRARVPYCWYAAISTDHSSFTLILEDLAPSAPGSQTAGCTVEQARDAVANLAALHASFWDDEYLATGLGWLTPVDAEMADLLGVVLQDAVPQFAAMFGDALPVEDTKTLQEAADVTADWALHRQTPFSLVHGDYRLDNLMFPAGGPGSAALDWQGVSIGHPGRDLAYFLSLSLPAEVRREHEQGLIAGYHRALVGHGVTGHSLADCRTGYRVGMLQGPLITVLGRVYSPAERTRESDAMFVSMATRIAQAIRDAGTLELLRE